METVRGWEREDGSRWPYWLLWALAIASAVGAYIVWRTYLAPLVTSVLKGSDDGPDVLGVAVLLPLLGPAVIAGAAHLTRRPWVWVVAALLAPAAMTGIAAAYSDELADQRRAKAVFNLYTNHFPDRELGRPGVYEQVDRLLTVCAQQDVPGLTQFCVEVNLTQPKGREVEGGYRYEVDEFASDGGFSAIEPFDCFGEPTRCPDE